MASLDTVLDKLSGLFSKDFVVSSVPVIAFLTLHGAVAYNTFPAARKWIADSYLADPTKNLAAAFFTLLFLVVVTYVLSTLNTRLRELLEGRYWPGFVASIFRQKYRARLERIEQDVLLARRSSRALRNEKDGWRQTLAAAAKTGKGHASCVFKGCPSLRRIARRVAWDASVTSAEVAKAVTDLSSILAANNTAAVDAHGPTKAARKLVDAHTQLLRVIDLAIARWQAAHADYIEEIQFEFAGKNVAPTRMGNIAAVAAYYAESRYSMNLQIFWTRLQRVIQSDAAYYAVIQESKRQLDFLVALLWHTMIFTLVWTLLLPLIGGNKFVFLVIAVGGVLLTRTWYAIALTQYKTFSDLVRAAIDLYRLGLLKELRVPAPTTTEQERFIWDSLGTRLGYNEWDNLPLQPP